MGTAAVDSLADFGQYIVCLSQLYARDSVAHRGGHRQAAELLRKRHSVLAGAAFLSGFSFRRQFAQQNSSDHVGLQSSAVCSLAAVRCLNRYPSTVRQAIQTPHNLAFKGYPHFVPNNRLDHAPNFS
jgi:hypothetical protein